MSKHETLVVDSCVQTLAFAMQIWNLKLLQFVTIFFKVPGTVLKNSLIYSYRYGTGTTF